jgi:hypothetical protein
MIYFGIDPGVSGSVSAIWDDGVPFMSCGRFDWTEHDIVDWFRQFDLEKSKAVIERVHAMPKQGVSSTFRFGTSYGFLRGVLVSLRIPFKDQTPGKWQTEMKCRSKGDKNVTKAAAQRLWPEYKITHRNADSLLLAEYARTVAWKM